MDGIKNIVSSSHEVSLKLGERLICYLPFHLLFNLWTGYHLRYEVCIFLEHVTIQWKSVSFIRMLYIWMKMKLECYLILLKSLKNCLPGKHNKHKVLCLHKMLSHRIMGRTEAGKTSTFVGLIPQLVLLTYIIALICEDYGFKFCSSNNILNNSEAFILHINV